jgi:hypothetical protein
VIAEIPDLALAELSIHRTEAGIKSPENAQSRKQNLPIELSFDPSSNSNHLIEGRPSKQESPILSISRGILTVSFHPKYRISEIPWKSVRKSPLTCKWRFPSSTAIEEILENTKDEPSIVVSDAGRTMDRNAEHFMKAYSLICLNVEPGPNCNERRDVHRQKHHEPRTFRNGGRVIDSNDEHFSKV